MDTSGGGTLPGGKADNKELLEPRSILLADPAGNLIVRNELDDLTDYSRFVQPEPGLRAVGPYGGSYGGPYGGPSEPDTGKKKQKTGAYPTPPGYPMPPGYPSPKGGGKSAAPSSSPYPPGYTPPPGASGAGYGYPTKGGAAGYQGVPDMYDTNRTRRN